MKQRRQFIRKLGVFTALLAMASTARTAMGTNIVPAKGKSANSEGNFLHMVFFWLKQEDGETRKRFLSELMKFIDNVDVIKTKHVGTPADTDRDVIDSTFSYSLVLSFDSKKEHDIYQEHPLHKNFINNASSLWERVLVYDSVKT